MSEVTVPMDDQALFSAATLPDPVAEAAAPVVNAEPQQTSQQDPPADTGQPRDEHGRFATKATDQSPQPDAVQPPAAQQQDARPEQADAIPSWRLREVSERARAAEARAADLERQHTALLTQLRQQNQPKPEPIDPLLDPERFRDQGVKQAIDPLVQQLANTREYFSRKTAIAVHGADAVTNAYKAFEAAVRSGDPKVAGLMQRVTNGPDPYEDLVAWHKEQSIVTDPKAWALTQIGEWAKDPTQRDAILKALGQQPAAEQAGSPQQQPSTVVKLPPSLSRVPGRATVPAGSLSDADLYAAATAR